MADEPSLFGEKSPFAGSAVWACAVYSLVPFVGVVFLPFVLVLGVVSLLRGNRSALRPMAAGSVILAVQLVLWWLLYAVPRWGVQV
jgi:hypothetical protein